MLPYEGVTPIVDICEGAGYSAWVADRLASMFFRNESGEPADGSFRLRVHQADALRVALAPEDADKRHIVVTAGTGSGKTECFLLPVFARLLAESEGWAPDSKLNRWWDRSASGAWAGVRAQGQREAGLRSLILYPTNALVEDQITRLRRAIRTAAIPGALGPRFFFGRYTSATGGAGKRPDKLTEPRVRRTAHDLREIEQVADRLDSTNEALVYQFPDPRHGEMVTRWDMVEAPPDILVTNYSMLNVMLMREREDPLFERTRQRLASDPSAVLTLVVDELHTFRGTQGSEVALVVRNLLYRLGLQPDSPQLRCIATSASLDATNGAGYVEEFFGVPGERFGIISGAPQALGPRVLLSAREFGEVGKAKDDGADYEEKLRGLAQDWTIGESVAHACYEGSTPRATPLTKVAANAFDQKVEASSPAMKAALDAIALGEAGASQGVSFRAHLFVRNVKGIWACSNPDCSAVDPEYQSPERMVGKLYAIPAETCRCGGKVLDLLYCDECGTASLGGFVEGEAAEGASGWTLGSGETSVPAGQPGLVSQREYGSYMWYWPGPVPSDVDVGGWTHAPTGGKPIKFRFIGARYSPLLGYLEPSSVGSGDGTMLQAAGWSPPLRIPALPEFCPSCFLRRFNRADTGFFQARVHSSIRGHRTGFARVTEVMLDRLYRSVGASPDEGKTIVFTDSRDDAARSAAGVELNHYRSLLRQSVLAELRSSVSPPELMRRALDGRGLTEDESQQLAQYQHRWAAAWAALQTAWHLRAAGADVPDAISATIRDFKADHEGESDRVQWGVLR